MNEDQLDDLKQFIAATVLQTEKRLKGKISNVRSELAGLHDEIADGFAGVGEAIEAINNQIGDHETKTDKRLTKLENQIA